MINCINLMNVNTLALYKCIRIQEIYTINQNESKET